MIWLWRSCRSYNIHTSTLKHCNQELTAIGCAMLELCVSSPQTWTPSSLGEVPFTGTCDTEITKFHIIHAHLPANIYPSRYGHPKWCKKFVNQPVLTATVPPSSLKPPPPNPLQPCGAGQWLRPNFHQDRVALPRTPCRRHRRGPARPAGWDAPPTPCRCGFAGSCLLKTGGR